uniref:Conjugative relaxosome accessory transposon protein n=1 Tax=Myoviridae sp. ct9MV2 TaxID=2826625 RepID=A0A8S5NCF9_9CAUD|nr:MAG TPA: Conjugative relaxosome accessory transposon protein [Myoviridae sp. ct9MV2]
MLKIELPQSLSHGCSGIILSDTSVGTNRIRF